MKSMSSKDLNIHKRNTIRTDEKINKVSLKREQKGSSHEGKQTTINTASYRIWARSVVIIAVVTLVYFYTKQKEYVKHLATVRENLPLRMQKVDCSASYSQELQKFPKCVPEKCGRFINDHLIETVETTTLLHLAKDIFSMSGSKGGASILDLHSGALSHEDKFINIYQFSHLVAKIQKEHLLVYKFVKSKIKLAIAERFQISPDSLYLTHPTFFSRLTNETAITPNDEYWHEHVDKKTYPSFHYTSLVYLNTFGKDFKGGRFVFVDGGVENRIKTFVEPKESRLSAFTSGEENLHHVEKVTEGIRYAITISFTCDPSSAIKDPEVVSETE